MSRPFDGGKNAYGNEHRNKDKDQQVLHTLGDDLLQHYGADSKNYETYSGENYRMGDSSVNGRDTKVDNAIIGSTFADPGRIKEKDYDASELAKKDVNSQQQLRRIGNKFDVAQTAYKETGEAVYRDIREDLRDIADNDLDADKREFHLPK